MHAENYLIVILKLHCIEETAQSLNSGGLWILIQELKSEVAKAASKLGSYGWAKLADSQSIINVPGQLFTVCMAAYNSLLW